MKKTFGLTMLAILMLSGLMLASAQEGPPAGPPGGFQGGGQRFQMPTFADLDKNKDKKISRDEFQGPPQYFDRLDENKDGFIDEEEYGRIRQRMGGGGGNFSERLKAFLDADKDGKVTREEFATMMKLFDALDSDKSGELSQEELGRFFQVMPQVQAQSTGGVDVNMLFTRHDKDKDGKITAEEVGNERVFKSLDLNKDGSVNREEAEEALKQLEKARQQRQSSNPPNNQ